MKEAINPYDELMIRVFDGYATETEQKQLNDWLIASHANQTAFTEFQKIWTGAADASVLHNLDIEADLKVVKAQAKMGNRQLATGNSQLAMRNPQPATRILFIAFLRKIAAILLLLAVIGIALSIYLNQGTDPKPILLSDGTKVWLYQDANLEYPETFTETTRSVKLTGEAFFEVAKDATKPFVIEAGASEIRVLGTSFNVQSAVNQTNVIVNTGKVQLSAKEAPEQVVELTKGEKGIYQNAIVKETINTDKNYRAWQNGIFEFDGSLPMEEVIAQLSKYYGKIEMNIATNADCSIVGEFEKEELSTVLEVIKNSCGY